jgi:hypothetical protein
MVSPVADFLVLRASVALSGFYNLGLSRFVDFDFLGLRLAGILFILCTALGHFAGGFLSGKTAPARRYTYAVFASISSLFLTLVSEFLQQHTFRLEIEELSFFLVLSIIFPAVALLGARWGFTKRAGAVSSSGI